MQLIIDYFKNENNQTYVEVVSITILCLIVLCAIIVFVYKRSGDQQEQDEQLKDFEKNEIPENIIDDDECLVLDNTRLTNDDSGLIEIAEGITLSDIGSKTRSTIHVIDLTEYEAEQYDKKENETVENASEDIEEHSDCENTTPKYSGKWVIVEEESKKYTAYLKASNGEKLLMSESYTSLSGIKSGIDTLKKNIERDNYAVSLDKNGKFIFKIFTSANRLLCVSEGHNTREQCEKTFLSVKRFSHTAAIVVEKLDD